MRFRSPTFPSFGGLVLRGLVVLAAGAVAMTPRTVGALPGRPLSVVPCDSDGDRLPDAVEDRNANHRVDPGETSAYHPDTDGDGVPDGVEDANANGRHDPGETSPLRADTDGDGIPDGSEDRNGNGRVDPGETDPRRPCSDPGRPCATREDLDGAMRGPRIPEPMVVDLVRGLGARRGELEVNALALFSHHNDRWHVTWAPELEWAPLDGVALEVELPMVHGHFEALKLAAQVTLGTLVNARAIHGLQGIVEATVDGSVDTTLFYLVGARWSRQLSTLLMLGGNVRVPLNRAVDLTARAHGTFFFESTPRFLLAVELGALVSKEWQRSVYDVVPQLRWRPSDHFTLQLGAGVQRSGQRTSPFLGTRIAMEW